MRTTSILATQFLERLNAIKDVEKQLSLALKTFTLFELPLTKKEELILEWLIESINGDGENIESKAKDDEENIERLINLYTTLEKCLASSQMKSDLVDIRPSVCDGIIKIIIYQGYQSDLSDLQKCAHQCSLPMLESPIFLRIFKQDIEKCQALMTSFFQYTSNSSPSNEALEGCVLAVKTLTSIYQRTLLKKVFQIQFVKKTMIRMIATSIELKSDDFDKEICKCLQQILFDRTSLNNYIDAIKNPGADENCAAIMKKILKFPKHCGPEIVEQFYPMFLRLFSKNFKNENEIFEMFLSLSAVVGCRPIEQCVNQELKPVKDFKNTNTLLRMLTVIKESNISLDAEVNDVHVSMWLISLLKSIPYDEPLTVDKLKLIREIFSFLDPIVVEQMFPNFVSNIMLKNKTTGEIITSYSEALNEIFNVFEKLSRIDKFIAKMLEEMVVFLHANKNVELSLEDVLPEEFRRAFDKAVTSQSIGASFSSLTTLRFYLEKILLPKVETEPFFEIQGSLILLDVIFELTSHLLRNMYVADDSVPIVVQEKFAEAFQELAHFLQKFGKALLTAEFNIRATKSFLDLSYTWGALNILLITYRFEGKDIVEEQTNTNATNLSYVLHFLPDTSWELLANRVLNRGNEEIKHTLFKLMIQKMGALRTSEEGYDGPASKVAHFLISNADSSWLCEHANSLLLFLGPNELLQLSDELLKCKFQHKLISLFKTEEFQENSDMVAAISISILVKIAGKCHKSGQSLLKKLLLNLDLEIILGNEADQVVSEEILKILEDLAVILSVGLKECSDQSYPVTPFIEKKLELLSFLPLSCLQSNTQTIILLSLIAAAHCLEYNTLLFDLIASILDSEDPIQLPDKINWSCLIHSILSKSQDYNFRDTMIECLLKVAFRSSANIKNIINFVASSPSEESLLISTVISQLLPKMMRKKRNVDGDLKDTLHKCENELRICLRFISEVKPEIRWLLTLRAAIHYHLKTNSNVNVDEVKKLSKLIPHYLDLILNKIVDMGELDDLEVEGSFLELILQNKKHLEFDLPSDIGALWTKLAGRLPVQNLQTFLQFVNTDQFSSILECLKTITSPMLDKSTIEDKVFLLWRVLVIAQLSSEKEGLRNDAVSHLSDMILQLTFTWRKSDSVMNVHGLLIAFASAVKVKMTSKNIEMCLEVVNATPVTAKPKLLNKAIELLSNLLRYRSFLMLDHIPQLLQQMSHLIAIVSRASHLYDMKYPAQELAAVAFSIEKLANVMVTDHKTHFARVAHYFVANVLKNFEEWTVEYSVKVHLQNVLFSFLSVCDHHAISFLMRSLPTTPQLMFKDLHERFNKYHQFSGRI